MLGAVGPVRGLRFAVCTLAAAVTLAALSNDPAQARWRRYRHYAAYTPAYAAIVVDANSGKELHAANADETRHPASLTKIMTLYLLFEQLEAGKLKLDTVMKASEHASEQAPTKVGLDEGDPIKVEDAIKALVTRSANDAAVVIAETIGGTEENFAKLMTRKARTLGMIRTVYVNASGLPDDEQITTARDQALLGRAIQDRFPQYYRYFATRSFVLDGEYMNNHNHLLGNVDGVDGIKTGYTRNSGFNIVTSVHRGNRFLVAVVLGGASAGIRDARMRQLIEQYIPQSATVRTAAKITETPDPVRVAEAKPQPQPQPQRPQAEAPTVVASNLAGTSQPIQPVRVKTISVKAGATTIPALMALQPAPQATVAPKEFAVARRDDAPAVAAPAPAAPAEANTVEAPPPVYQTASASETPVASPATARGGWVIQVGAFPEEEKAKERLREAQTLGKTVVANANPFTEKVMKGKQEMYRARFAGFDQTTAEAACHYFKRNDIVCMAMKN